MKLSNQTFKAAAYLRLSKEDADIQKSESDSISNQKALIRNFVKDNPDIEIENFYVDDGFTGLLFDRPAFQQMLSDITAGRINCVIVKDLSRFGREYINAGKYMHQFSVLCQLVWLTFNTNLTNGVYERSCTPFFNADQVT